MFATTAAAATKSRLRVLAAALFAILLAVAALTPAAASRGVLLDAVPGAAADDRLLVSGVAERRRLVQYGQAEADDDGGVEPLSSPSSSPSISAETVEDLLSRSGAGGPDFSF